MHIDRQRFINMHADILLEKRGGFSIKLISFYLIACSLLLALGVAEDNNSESLDRDFAENSYKSAYDSYSQMPNAPEVASMAYPVSDLNGDRAVDLLVMNISSEADTEGFNSEVLAMSGADGSIIWQKEYPDTLVFAAPAGDLNGDGQTDFLVDEMLAEPELNQFSSVSAIDGSNGTEIWSRPQALATTVAYPIKDINADNASEFLVHIIGMDSINNSMFTRIFRLSGADGSIMDDRIFSGALAIEYPVGNLTSDSVPDSVLAIYQLNGSMMSEGEDVNITATTFEAIDGQGHKKLWSYSFEGPALALPETDLTGDGQDEVAVYIIKSSENASTSNDIAVLQGSDGELLWQQSFAGFMAIALPGPDLTGDGQKDLVIYKLAGSEGTAEVLAVKGDDGRLLWSRAGMTYIPPEFISQNLFSFLPAFS